MRTLGIAVLAWFLVGCGSADKNGDVSEIIVGDTRITQLSDGHQRIETPDGVAEWRESDGTFEVRMTGEVGEESLTYSDGRAVDVSAMTAPTYPNAKDDPSMPSAAARLESDTQIQIARMLVTPDSVTDVFEYFKKNLKEVKNEMKTSEGGSLAGKTAAGHEVHVALIRDVSAGHTQITVVEFQTKN